MGKEIITLWLLFVTAVIGLEGCDKMSYRDQVLSTRPSNIIAYYEFNNNLNDSGQWGLTGATGTATYTALGDGVDGGRAADFDGTQEIDLGSNFHSQMDTNDGMNGHTINLFVKVTSGSGWSLSGDFLKIQTDDSHEITLAHAGNFFGNAVTASGSRVGSGGGTIAWLVPDAWPDDQEWVMYTMVHYPDNRLDLYVNGRFLVQYTVGVTTITGSVNYAKMGVFGSWAGYIDELTIWAAQLTAEEIAALWAASQGAQPREAIGAEAIIRVFDRTGVLVGEINPTIDFVTWKRNGIGKAQLLMSKSDPKAAAPYLAAQNRLLIEWNNGLTWGGVMLPGFSFDQSMIVIKAETGESLLKQRVTDRGRYFDNATIGEIGEALIEEANAIWPTGLTVGAIWPGGDVHSPSYHFKSLYNIFTKSLFSRLSLADFYAVPIVGSDGRLTFQIRIEERRGRDITGSILAQGFNVEAGSVLKFEGPIVNRWVVVGDGQGWGESRPTAEAFDQDSINQYGLLEPTSPPIYTGIVEVSTLQTIANNLLAQTRQPRTLLDITAVNAPPARFVDYGLGDTIPVELPNYGLEDGFIGRAKIEAAAFYPSTGRLNLVLDTSNV